MPTTAPAGPISKVSLPRPVAQTGRTASISALDDFFRPGSITVTVGTTVVWTNGGQNPHTVTAADRSFDSGTLEPGQTYSMTFDRVGEVPYYCQIHGEPGSGMTGVVLVQAAEPGAPGDDPAADPGTGDVIAATGSAPIALGVVSLALASVGIGALAAARRAGRRSPRGR